MVAKGLPNSIHHELRVLLSNRYIVSDRWLGVEQRQNGMNQPVQNRRGINDIEDKLRRQKLTSRNTTGIASPTRTLNARASVDKSSRNAKE